MCGLAGLDAEARQARAKAILDNTEWKQQFCNELLGLSFRELERVLNGVATERHIKSEDEKVYRNEKLATYSGTRATKHTGSSHKAQAKSQPRTLEQILAQVYGPRAEPVWTAEEKSQLLYLRRAEGDNGDISPDPDADTNKVGT